jgi:signal transduction histidine kinase
VTRLAKLLSTTTFRWLLAYSLLFGLAAAGVVGYIYWQTNDLLTRQVVQTLASEVKGLREQFELGGIRLLDRVVAERSSNAGNGLYFLGAAEGAKLSGNLSGFPSELPSDAGGGAFHYARAGTSGADRNAVGVAIAVPGGYSLVVGRDIEDQRDFTDTVRRILLWGLGSIAALGLGGGLLASRGILGRIEAMRATSDTIMAGDLSQRVPVTGAGDELDRLGHSLNGMLERIEQLMTAMREVSDNVAHDLRTPLSRLRARLESGLREASGGGVPRETVARSIEDTDELIKTFNAMLSLARLEAGTVGERSTLDLGALIADAAELYEPLADEKGVQLIVDAGSGLLVQADQQLLGQAVTNLIDNALKYGAVGNPSVVSLSARAASGFAEIAVADHGLGIAEADRERALKRFVRLETSRSQPGSGLGLSLVAAVARLHGGSVRLEDNRPGLRVVIALPMALPQTAAANPASRRLEDARA